MARAKRLCSADFPQTSGGDQLAYTWFIGIDNPAHWLAEWAASKGVTPHTNPYLLPVERTKQAIADVICPRRTYARCGIGVNFEMHDPQHTHCTVVYYSMDLKSWWDIKNNYARSAHFAPAFEPVPTLKRRLARGSHGRQVIGAPLYCGTPIGDNMEFLGRSEGL